MSPRIKSRLAKNRVRLGFHTNCHLANICMHAYYVNKGLFFTCGVNEKYNRIGIEVSFYRIHRRHPPYLKWRFRLVETKTSRSLIGKESPTIQREVSRGTVRLSIIVSKNCLKIHWCFQQAIYATFFPLGMVLRGKKNKIKTQFEIDQSKCCGWYKERGFPFETALVGIQMIHKYSTK